MYGNLLKPVCEVVKTIDNTGKVLAGLQSLAKEKILIGVPQAKSSREGGKNITNAELAFLHEHGFRAPKWAVLNAYKQNPRTSKNKKAISALEAYIHAKGSPYWNVPARPFLEPSVEANKDGMVKLQAGVIKKALNGDVASVEAGCNAIGLYCQANAKKWFTDPRNNWSPNHPLIAALKGSDKPLIDTAGLRNSISYVRERE